MWLLWRLLLWGGCLRLLLWWIWLLWWRGGLAGAGYAPCGELVVPSAIVFVGVDVEIGCDVFSYFGCEFVDAVFSEYAYADGAGVSVLVVGDYEVEGCPFFAVLGGASGYLRDVGYFSCKVHCFMICSINVLASITLCSMRWMSSSLRVTVAVWRGLVSHGQ